MKGFLIFIGLFIVLSCKDTSLHTFHHTEVTENSINNQKDTINDEVSAFRKQLSAVALEIIDPTIKYTPDYVSIAYPNGDVPAKTGVCTDVIIRAYRKLSIDLQKEVHEDMRNSFGMYPKTWGLNRPDTNIDHRRVPNLETFFRRKGKELPITQNAD